MDPISGTSKILKQKQIISQDVIDIDKDENSADAMFIGEQFDSGNGGDQLKEHLLNCSFDSGVEVLGSVNRVDTKTRFAESHNLANSNDRNSDSFNENDECHSDIHHDDSNRGDYSVMEYLFDHMDIPPGVEAHVPWMQDLTQNKRKPVTESSSGHKKNQYQSHSAALSLGNSKLQSEMDTVGLTLGFDKYVNWFQSRPGKSKNKAKATISLHKASSMTLPSGVEQYNATGWLEDLKKKVQQGTSNSSTNSPHLHAMKLNANALYHPPEGGSSMPWWPVTFPSEKQHVDDYIIPNSFDLFDSPVTEDLHWNEDAVQTSNNLAATSSSTPPLKEISSTELVGILKKFELFKQFDTVEDYSDHHYARHVSSSVLPSKDLVKRIQEEWKMLEKGLPDAIFVRAYETSTELMRVVIVGAEGTPYRDGLFFFDIFFPSCYPNVPPHVYYHSGGLRLNPNLYECGKVCLSLLNTWPGNESEMWIPGVSTMLQVLVSIQALILNSKPFFNEPVHAHMNGSIDGEIRSHAYNEGTYILSLKTMMYKLRRPPKHFEDFVLGHFNKRARDILVACRAYMDGTAQIGSSVVINGAEDAPVNQNIRLKKFKGSLASCMGKLVEEFTRIGAKNCETFLPSSSLTYKSKGVDSVAQVTA